MDIRVDKFANRKSVQTNNILTGDETEIQWLEDEMAYTYFGNKYEEGIQHEGMKEKLKM
jgi:hypothetical protein